MIAVFLIFIALPGTSSHQVIHWHFKGLADPIQHGRGRLRRLVFQTSDISVTEAAPFGQLFLRQCLFSAPVAQLFPVQRYADFLPPQRKTGNLTG